MSPTIITLSVLGLLAIVLILYYNKLVSLKMRVEEAWSDISVQLKRRNSLIPNLVDTVKGYMDHERELLEEITRLRSKVEEAEGPQELGELNQKLTSALGKLQIQVENYPELKANENFMQLQEELTNTEDKIAYSRRFYNTNVMTYNTMIKSFPGVVVAGPLGFDSYEFFEATEEEMEDVDVDFSEEKKPAGSVSEESN